MGVTSDELVTSLSTLPLMDMFIPVSLNLVGQFMIIVVVMFSFTLIWSLPSILSIVSGADGFLSSSRVCFFIIIPAKACTSFDLSNDEASFFSTFCTITFT